MVCSSARASSRSNSCGLVGAGLGRAGGGHCGCGDQEPNHRERDTTHTPHGRSVSQRRYRFRKREHHFWSLVVRPGLDRLSFSAKRELMSEGCVVETSGVPDGASRDQDLVGGFALDVAPPTWHDAAMCRGKTEIFFARPGEREGRRKRREALAQAYCACCPVAAACRAAGRERREHGLWGGETDEQRAAAGFGPPSPHRRAVAAAARKAREVA